MLINFIFVEAQSLERELDTEQDLVDREGRGQI